MPPTPSPPESPRRARSWLFAWSAFWAIFAVLHVTQAIWLSGGAACPGDLNDGRFNHLVLEHGYQSLCGREEWLSPAQFYPVKHTLGYSDTFAGTVPIYAAFRVAGLDSERAWQAWYVAIAALNVLAGLHLFRALGVGGFLRAPLVFAAVSAPTIVWLTSTNMQFLQIFPMLLAWAELARWYDNRRAIRLVAASGAYAWQFAAAPYLAFFGGAVTLAVVAPFVILERWLGTRDPAPTPPQPARWYRIYATLLCVIGWGLGSAAAYAYLSAEHAGTRRGLTTVVGFAPPLSSWFTSNPVSIFYPPGWPSHNANAIDEAWFAGFLPWIALAAALALGIRIRTTPRGRWLLALSTGALLVMLFFTRWSPAHPGAWVTAAKLLPPLRAFRFSGRVAVLLRVGMVAAAGVVLATWRPRRWRFAPAALAALLALESLSHRQPSVNLALSRARTEAMIAAWQRAGDRPVLAFAFGRTNQRNSLAHLDAWSAAMRLHRHTIDGYSSGFPAGYEKFFWSGSVADARAILAAKGIPEDEVSLVERFSLADDAKLGIAHPVPPSPPR